MTRASSPGNRAQRLHFRRDRRGTGFRGSLLLLTAFALLLIQGLFIAFYSRDVSGRLVACLVVALFFAHIFESIGMCVLIMPITGIPLPLVSYSGTFVVICMFLLGLVQSVWIHRNRKPGWRSKKPRPGQRSGDPLQQGVVAFQPSSPSLATVETPRRLPSRGFRGCDGAWTTWRVPAA